MNGKTITRETAVARIRAQLLAMSREGKSVCEIAAEKKIFCRGFHRDTDDELRWRYADRIPGALGMMRDELELHANAWHLGRQKQEGTLLCCDVQAMCYETCRAWDDFSNEDLARFCLELSGEATRVRGAITLPIV